MGMGGNNKLKMQIKIEIKLISAQCCRQTETNRGEPINSIRKGKYKKIISMLWPKKLLMTSNFLSKSII